MQHDISSNEEVGLITAERQQCSPIFSADEELC